jgi:hypothetical protein
MLFFIGLNYFFTQNLFFFNCFLKTNLIPGRFEKNCNHFKDINHVCRGGEECVRQPKTFPVSLMVSKSFKKSN